MKYILIIFVFIILPLINAFGQVGVGSITSKSIMYDIYRIKEKTFAVNWEYEGKEYVICYEPIEKVKEKYPDLNIKYREDGNSYLNQYDTYTRDVYVFGRSKNEDWEVKSDLLFKGSINSNHIIDYHDTPLPYGSGLVKVLDDGNVLVTQRYKDIITSQNPIKYVFVFTFLKFNKQNGTYSSFSEVYPNIKAHSYAKDIIKINDHEYELMMNNGEKPIRVSINQ